MCTKISFKKSFKACLPSPTPQVIAVFPQRFISPPQENHSTTGKTSLCDFIISRSSG